MMRITTSSDTNDYEGFMTCLKLPNRKCVKYIIIKRNVLDNVENVTINYV